MSEMSREEIIKWLTQREKCSNEIPIECCARDCEDCPNNYDESREMEIVKEIISDMEKLQKIEALYEPQEFGKGISREERDREVQKILEGK